ncbi:MAG: hypothetical protein KGD64_08145, partial [Candidatus Heimdallarchaeota archaeon]|nr:hypothetical protein [Candidatus Heimdallarchaeota archaeon]
MKVVFVPNDKSILSNQLEEIADYYQTKAVPHDTGEGHFIFVKSRIMITEIIREDKVQIYATGVNDDDLIFLSKFWGEPISIIKEKLTPLEFAVEIADIPNIEQFDKLDIINLLD